MRGQGYDGAANMSGKYNGVQARIKELVPGAEYTHCQAHNLNLCIIHACEESLVRNMIDTAQKIAFVFDYSAKKLAMYKENLWQNEDAKRAIDDQQKLKTLCETRWDSRSDALFTFKASLVTVHEVLRVLKSDHSCSDAGAYQAAEEKFDFIVTLVVAEHVLSALMQLSIFLQKKDCDLAIAAAESRTVKSILNAGQNDPDVWDTLYQSAVNLAGTLETQPSMPRNRATMHQNHRPNATTEDISSYWMINMYLPFMDHLLSDMDSRLLNAEPQYITQKLIPTMVSELNNDAADQIYTAYADDMIGVTPEGFQQNCGAGGWNGRMAMKLPRIYRVPSMKPMPCFIPVYSVY